MFDFLEPRAQLSRIELQALSVADVREMVSDALRSSSPATDELASLIFEKTSGNPFFIAQFLERLATEKHLRFEPGRKWPRPDLVILGITVVSGLVAGLAHVVTLPWYAQNDGSEVQFWLPENLAFYINPLHLFRQEKTYGVPIPTGYSIMTLLMVVIAVAWGWRRLPPRFRAYAAWAAVINLSLMMLFAFPGEIRNLTFLLPSLVLCLGKTIDVFFPPANATDASPARGGA